MNEFHIGYNPLLKNYSIHAGPKKRLLEDSLTLDALLVKTAEILNPKRKTNLYLHQIQEELIRGIRKKYKGTKIRILEK